MARKNENEYFWDYDIKNSVGKVHAYNGNFGILVRAFVYIKMLGEEGVKNMTKHAILNANYNTRYAFFAGYYLADRAKCPGKSIRLSNKGKIGTAMLFYLTKSLGLNVV